MSWDQPAYSFGVPNTQPPTPTKTPTCSAFPSPLFQTPRGNRDAFDDRSGWTPNFAEEYSVFNATPGRLISSHSSAFEATTPRPSTASSNNHPLSSTEELAVELASHVHHIAQGTLPLPPVETSRQLSSSPGTIHGDRTDERNTKTTPRKSRRRLHDASGGQTATPPQSISKGSRKLAPKLHTSTMQRDEEHVNMFDTPGPQHISNFPSMGDMSMFPMSAPATAPAFTTTKPFWDPDTHLTNVNVNNPAGHESLFGGTVSYRSSNSFDWGRDNQTFRQTDNISSFDPDISQDSKFRKSLTSGTQARPIATSTGLSFDFGGLMSHDPFAMANSMSGVDPGLLFTVPTDTSASMQRIRRGGDGQSLQGPERSYQQSFRDQEEFKRDGTMKDYSALTQHYKPAFSSSANPTRPGLQRSLSDSRTRRLSGQRSSHLSSTSLRLEPRALSRTGRTSPAKQVSRPSLASIPESAPRVRTEVKFIIDANGRARTDTTTIVDDPKTAIERSLSDDYDSSPSDSSTDDEPIMIPNRTSSLVLPAKRMDPRVSGFDTARRSIEGRRRSSSALGQSPRGSPSQLEEDSEAETVMEGDSGNAMHALRKVMDNRNRVKKRPGSTQPHLYSNTSPYQYASTNISPLTTTDPDLATPSTDRESSISDSTRCICGRRDGDVFMIQCESCEKWLHGSCVGISSQRLPKVYICAFCAQTPNMRGGRIREAARSKKIAQAGSSPLAHKGFKNWR